MIYLYQQIDPVLLGVWFQALHLGKGLISGVGEVSHSFFGFNAEHLGRAF